jgi:hypothetical protein
MVVAGPRTLQIWRVVLCATTAIDTLLVTFLSYRQLRYDPAVHPPLGGATLIALLAAATCATIAFALYARPSAQYKVGIVAFVASAACFALANKLQPTGSEDFVQASASFLGWVLGDIMATAAEVRRDDRARTADRWAATGFLSLLASTYINAGASKVLFSHGQWASSSSLRLMVLAHYEYGMNGALDPLRRWLADQPHVCAAAAAATLCVQLGAGALFLSPNVRRLWALSLIGLHAGIYIASRILFFQVMIILATIVLADHPLLRDEEPGFDLGAPPSTVKRVMLYTAAAAVILVAYGAIFDLGGEY